MRAVIVIWLLLFFVSPACQKKVTTVASPPSDSESAPFAIPPVDASAGSSESPSPAEPARHAVSESSPRSEESKLDAEIEPLKKELEIERMRETPPPAPAAEPEGKMAETGKRKASTADVAGYLDNPTPVYIIDADKPGSSASARPASAFTGAAAASVKAASHDDNEEIVSYRDFCSSVGDRISPYPWDVSQRYIIRLVYPDSSTAWNHSIGIVDEAGKMLFSARTPASGEIVLLPKIDLDRKYGDIDRYRLSIDNGAPRPIKKSPGDMLAFTLSGRRQLPDTLTLQICFLMDCTGSMSDEIAQLQDVIFSIHSRIVAMPSRPNVQFSIVEYRDKKDAFIVRGHHFTGDIDAFQMTLEKVEAAGGGDTPEDIESGFAWCLDSLKWREEALKFIFLVADAPPHLNKKARNYLEAAKQCRSRAIMVCPVGASGLDITGEFVFRQIALLTRGQFVFLHYGETGESDGSATAADPGKVSHHTGANYNARRLDDIVVDIVSGEVGYLTPAAKIVRAYPEPKEQDDLLDLRMTNLLRQVVATTMPPAGKSLVVSPFSVADTALGQLAEFLWEDALEKLPSYTGASIIERQRLTELLKEKAISLSGLIEDQPAVDVGRMLNADYMLLSRLHFLGATRLCHMRLVDCATGAVVRAARVRL